MFIRKYWVPLSVFLVLIVGVSVYYLQTRPPEDPIVIIKPVEPIGKPTINEGAVGETDKGGHFHEDGTWHAGPHNALRQPTEAMQSGYWENGNYIRPAGYVIQHSRGQTSSNPFFADGVPEHLKCPPELVGEFMSETTREIYDRTIVQIAQEVRANYNPNRPIHVVWPLFIEDEKFYLANADPPIIDETRVHPDELPLLADERSNVSCGRLDWQVQSALDYPEIIKLLVDDPAAHDMWRVELGWDPPNWNLITLPDGRKFREKAGYYYEFTYTEHVSDTASNTVTLGTGISGEDAPLIKVNLNETSDEELRQLGMDFNNNPYREEP